jgi:NADPH-dependent 2,4-dienoyl-CoA reductase/sulfur reductase-like enzyme
VTGSDQRTTLAQNPEPVVVVGAGAAGLAMVTGLRGNGFQGQLSWIGAEAALPYDRPPLSKEVLTAARTPEQIGLCTWDKVAELDVDLRLGITVTGVDINGRKIMLSDGNLLPFGCLVAATGVTPRTLPGSESVAGVHTVRTLDDTMALRAELGPGRRLVVIGGGFLGTELAAAARSLGTGVVLLDPGTAPLAAAIGAEVGTMIADLHREHGVEVRTGPGAAVVRVDAPGGTFDGVALADGTTISAGAALVAIGSVPVTGWLAETGVDRVDGLRCDEFCETDIPGVYAVGDVSSWYHIGLGAQVRLEHRTNAAEQGLYVARRMLGRTAEPFAPVPYFWSDQYDLKIQAYGLLRGHDEVRVVDSAIADREFVALYRRGDRLAGVLGVRRARALRQWRAQVAAGVAWSDVPGTAWPDLTAAGRTAVWRKMSSTP